MGLVYSTESGRLCPRCEHPISACTCRTSSANRAASASGDGSVSLQRQKHGRAGKVVTTITGVNMPAAELKQFARQLKQLCGSGGTVNDGVIEIQGDHRLTLKSELDRLGYKTKLSGS